MQKNLTVVVRLEPQYGASSTATCFPAVPPLRDLADPGTNRTSYKKIAASYARVVSSLPQPPGNDTPFYVQVVMGRFECDHALQVGNCTDLALTHAAVGITLQILSLPPAATVGEGCYYSKVELLVCIVACSRLYC
eukprot:m.176136 g.176136  ORF g.176136 m.176136 type:complete len:136 (-) comp17934_c0_seq2:981-1388(-)